MSDPDKIKEKIKGYIKEQKELVSRISVFKRMATTKSYPEESRQIFNEKLKKAKNKLKGTILNISKFQNELEEIKE